jgi:hypothetical protein
VDWFGRSENNVLLTHLLRLHAVAESDYDRASRC